MLEQEAMIIRVRQACKQNEQMVAALMYGSFTKSEADAFSDIEFYLFLEDGAVGDFDPAVWLAQIAPVALTFVNQMGTVIAIFENLVRGEFHIEPASQMSMVRTWKKNSGFPPPENMLVLDRTGELMSHLRHISGRGPDRNEGIQVAQIWYDYLNWMLFGHNVLARGEDARALEILTLVHRHLLWLVRVREDSTAHWPTPSKNLEQDLSATAYQRFRGCTAMLEKRDLAHAYGAAWEWGKEMARPLAVECGFDMRHSLVRKLDVRFSDLFQEEL